MRTRPARAVFAAACAVALAAGGASHAAPADDGPAAGPGPDLVFEAALDSATVRLGDDVTIRLTAKNHSTSPVDVASFRIAQDAVTVRVAWGGEDRAVVTRVYAEWIEDLGALRPKAIPTAPRRLAPGESMSGSVSFAAVRAGEMTVTPVWAADRRPGDDAANAPARREAKPLAVAVQPLQGQPRRLVAQVETSAGAFAVELDGAAAFNTVSHFWRLAREGFYDGLTVHRVEPGLLAQGGDPRGDGTGGAGWTIPAEGPATALSRGAFGLARGAHADTASSQWFAIADAAGRAATVFGAKAPEWTPLGRVIEGQDVVDALAAVETDPRTARPKSPPAITAVRAVVR